MRVSLQWLRDLVPFRSDVDSLAEQLSMAGFEVEEQEDLAARAAGVVVGQVLSSSPPSSSPQLPVFFFIGNSQLCACLLACGFPQPQSLKIQFI